MWVVKSLQSLSPKELGFEVPLVFCWVVGFGVVVVLGVDLAVWVGVLVGVSVVVGVGEGVSVNVRLVGASVGVETTVSALFTSVDLAWGLVGS